MPRSRERYLKGFVSGDSRARTVPEKTSDLNSWERALAIIAWALPIASDNAVVPGIGNGDQRARLSLECRARVEAWRPAIWRAAVPSVWSQADIGELTDEVRLQSIFN
jgi:hypothetical protein